MLNIHTANLRNVLEMTKLKEVAGGFLIVMEHRGRKQLRGVGVVPYLERFCVEPYIVHYVGEPTGVERPTTQVAHHLGFYEHFVGAPIVEVAACAAEHGEQGLDNGKVGISHRAVYSVALAYLGNKLAVGAVGVSDEPVIHFADTKHLIHDSIGI